MIFEEQISRKPDLYPWTQDFISSMWRGHWIPDDFDFQSDIQDFKVNITDQERIVIQNTLSAIAQVEVAVKRFWGRLGDNLPHPSLIDLGYVMSHVEVIHNKAYEKLLDVLNLEGIFEENLKLDIIQGRVNYLRKYTHKYYSNSKKQYLYALILFTLFVENVSLFSQFYVILFFNKFKNLLKDTAQQVQYTKNEELTHSLVGIKLVRVIKEEYPELFDQELVDKIKYEAGEAFKAESKIVDWIIGDYQHDYLNKEILKEYIKNRINESLDNIGFGKIFEINENLLEHTQWMEEETLGETDTDFFHKRPVNYSRKAVECSDEDLIG